MEKKPVTFFREISLFLVKKFQLIYINEFASIFYL